MTDRARLSITEFTVLGVLAAGPNHGFAISKELGPDGDVGRVFTVRRPLVYRALDRLVETGLAEPVTTEQEAGPKRTIHRVSGTGRSRLRRWLAEPVEHVRDLRLVFLLKLALLQRAGESPLPLIRAQRAALEPTLAALDDTEVDPHDHVELWRRHNAAAAAAYLADLEEAYSVSGR